MAFDALGDATLIARSSCLTDGTVPAGARRLTGTDEAN